MALLAEAKRVAAEFDFPDDVVRAIGDEFVAEMSACSSQRPHNLHADNDADEGLEKNATTMSQIPTYVTGVPNGTEKVCKTSCPPI